MTNHDHERAMELIMRHGTEEISARDSAWLQTHVELCMDCAEYADDFNQAGRLLQSVAITASQSLVTATQVRVRARALHMQEQQSRVVLIAISFCIGALSSTISAWLWWKFGGWVADRLGLSSAIVEPGVLLFLLAPAAVIALLLLAFPHGLLERPGMPGMSREREGEIR